MDVASEMYQGQQLYHINMCRLALKVTYLSDITSVDGKRILFAYYQGGGHRESGRQTRLNWPPVGDLPAQWWERWREFLSRWCGTALQLPTPLGGWYEGIEHLTLCSFFMYENRLIMQRNNDIYYEFLPVTPKARTRFDLHAHPFHETALLEFAMVVDVSIKSKCIYVIARSKQNIISQTSAPRASGLEDLYRHLSPEVQRIVGEVEWPDFHGLLHLAESIKTGTILGVSDGSVRTREERASQAWILQAPNGSEIIGRGPVDGSTRARTSHRAELQGQTALFVMLSLLMKYFRIMGGKINTYCDNQAVVTKLQKGWRQWRYRNTKGADGDLQALIRTTLNDLEITNGLTYTTEWVQGHQDDNATLRHLPRPAALNVRMDGMTKEAYDLPAHWQSQAFVPVFRSEGCAVYIGNDKITSNIQSTSLEQWHNKEAREYFQQRHGINTAMFDSIHWPSLRYALKKLSPHRRAMAVKIIHRHLPTQEKLFK